MTADNNDDELDNEFEELSEAELEGELPEDEQKILLAMFILGKGKIGVDIHESDIFSLCDQMSLEELIRNAKRISDAGDSDLRI